MTPYVILPADCQHQVTRTLTSPAHHCLIRHHTQIISIIHPHFLSSLYIIYQLSNKGIKCPQKTSEYLRVLNKMWSHEVLTCKLQLTGRSSVRKQGPWPCDSKQLTQHIIECRGSMLIHAFPWGRKAEQRSHFLSLWQFLSKHRRRK